MIKQFEIIALADFAKQHSEIAIGGKYWGEIDEQGKRIYYTDCVGIDWIFYVGNTCKLI